MFAVDTHNHDGNTDDSMRMMSEGMPLMMMGRQRFLRVIAASCTHSPCGPRLVSLFLFLMPRNKYKARKKDASGYPSSMWLDDGTRDSQTFD